MSIIVSGGDGYLGWPTALRIADRTDERVVLVDSFGRREWVEEVGATSATPIAWPEERLEAAAEVHGLRNLSFVEGDLTDRSFVDQLLQVHEPSTIVHTAAQPSGTASGRTTRSTTTCRRRGTSCSASPRTTWPTPTSSRRPRRASTGVPISPSPRVAP
jgi:nucleoside-diphosphate-sugar epimerase